MIHLGKLRHRLTLEAPQTVPDGAGGSTNTWAELAILWAEIRASTGFEREAADRTTATVSHTITIRARTDIAPEQRFRKGARVFLIRAVFDPTGRGRFLTCLCDERDL